MLQKIKQFCCYGVIILLLPYVVTVFLNGPTVETSSNIDNLYVKVRYEDSEIELPLEEYCVGRIAKEIPVSYEKEALKAQAILVRTSVYKKLKESGSNTVLEEEFLTMQEMGNRDYKKMQEIWQETAGKVLTYDGNLAITPFCRLTNGNTRDGQEVLGSADYPYIKIRECPLDIESNEQIHIVVLEDMDVEVLAMDTAGYVTKVRVGQEQISGEEFAATYGLISSCVSLQKYEGKLRITTRGAGHGLGLSQYTANEMAKEGRKAEEILSYFFEGTEVKEVADIVVK